MSQENYAASFFSDMQDKYKEMLNTMPTAMPFDVKAVMEAQRKNMQAINEANQKMVQGWQAMAKRQAEMVSQCMQGNSVIANAALKDGTPQDKFASQAEAIKSLYEMAVSSSQELATMARQCSQDSMEVLSRRLADSVAEAKNAVKK